MKTNKKYNVMTNSEVKKQGREEISQMLKSPSYGMRVLNRFAEGKETKGIEGLSHEGVRETYLRACEASGEKQGFGWNTLIARNGACVTSMRRVKLTDRLYFAENEWHVEVNGRTYMCEEFDGVLYVLTTSEWSYKAIHTSTHLWLRMREAAARAEKNLYSWQQARKDSKRKANKQARKQARKQAQQQAQAQPQVHTQEASLESALEMLKKAMNEGTLSAEQIAMLQAA